MSTPSDLPPPPAASGHSLIVSTPDGEATLSVYAYAANVEIGRPNTYDFTCQRGHRLILTSRINGAPDHFAVLERAARDSTWRFITADLTADQLDNWRSHRDPTRPAAESAVDQWLTALFARHRRQRSA